MSNLPTPAKRETTLYGFERLEPTQQMIIPVAQAESFPKIRSAASHFSKKHGVWLRCTKQDNGTLVVYRDLDNAGPKGGGRPPVAAKLPVYEPPPPPPVGGYPPVVDVPAAVPPGPLYVAEKTPAEKVSALVGPTHDEWCNMLAKMQIADLTQLGDKTIAIDEKYREHFAQMQAWTYHYASATYRSYAAIIFNKKLQITRGADIEFAAFDLDVSNDAIEAEADNAQLPVVTDRQIENADIHTNGSQETIQPIHISINNDGWTGHPCPKCSGTDEELGTETTCLYCGGSGEEYIAALDKRTAEPVQSTHTIEPATSQSLAGISAFIDKQAAKESATKGTGDNKEPNYF